MTWLVVPRGREPIAQIRRPSTESVEWGTGRACSCWTVRVVAGLDADSMGYVKVSIE